MDVGSTNGWNFDQVVTKRELIEMIHKVYPLEPAEAHTLVKLRSDIGTLEQMLKLVLLHLFLSHFVSLCTRARISADGKFYTCLFATEGLM